MKSNYFLILLLCVSTGVFAQKSKRKTDKKEKSSYIELGVNISAAVKTFVQNRTDSLNFDPYSINFKAVGSGGLGLRLGAGYTFRGVKDVTLIQARATSLQRLDLRAGVEKQVKIDDRWKMYCGIDFLYGKETGSDEFSEGGNIYGVEFDENKIGAGPIFGIQYRLTKRVSFQTEAALYAVNIRSKKTYVNSANPGLKDSETYDSWNFPPGIPRSIAVIIRF